MSVTLTVQRGVRHAWGMDCILTWKEVVPDEHAEEHEVVDDTFNVHLEVGGEDDGGELQIPILPQETNLKV